MNSHPNQALEELCRVRDEFRSAADAASATPSQGIAVLGAMTSATAAAFRAAADSLGMLEYILAPCEEGLRASTLAQRSPTTSKSFRGDEEGSYSCRDCGGGVPAYYIGDGCCPDCWPRKYSDGDAKLARYLEAWPGWASRKRRLAPAATLTEN